MTNSFRIGFLDEEFVRRHFRFDQSQEFKEEERYWPSGYKYTPIVLQWNNDINSKGNEKEQATLGSRSIDDHTVRGNHNRTNNTVAMQQGIFLTSTKFFANRSEGWPQLLSLHRTALDSLEEQVAERRHHNRHNSSRRGRMRRYWNDEEEEEEDNSSRYRPLANDMAYGLGKEAMLQLSRKVEKQILKDVLLHVLATWRDDICRCVVSPASAETTPSKDAASSSEEAVEQQPAGIVSHNLQRQCYMPLGVVGVNGDYYGWLCASILLQNQTDSNGIGSQHTPTAT